MTKADEQVPSMFRPPKDGAKVKGAGPSKEQDVRYHEIIAKIKAGDDAGRKYQLQLAHMRGGHARKLLDAKNKTLYGERTIDEIAADLDIKRLSLQRCIEFHKLISSDQLEELCAVKPTPPSWRMMSQWVSYKNEDDRNRILKDILSGNLTPSHFDTQVREMLNKGPSVPKCPSNVQSAFEKINSMAITMKQHLAWIPKTAKALPDIADPAARRKAREAVKETLKSLEEARDDLDIQISVCKKLVSGD